MHDPQQRLWQLAEAACQHSRDEGRFELATATFEQIGQWLLAQRHQQEEGDSGGDESHLETLAACFGAWLGWWAVRTLDGQWVGLHEPCAPRVRVGGEVFSPIDAIRRILFQQPNSLSVASIGQRFQAAKEAFDGGAQRYLARNRQAWDERSHDARFAGLVQLPRNPTEAIAAIDPWIRVHGLAGRDLLCLAGGGGLHGPLYALAGARVTVVDCSPEQLAHDERFVRENEVAMRIVRQSIDDLHTFDDASFDFVVQPVSSCYLPDLAAVYREVARVMRPGGVYVSQHKSPGSLQADFGAHADSREQPSTVESSPYRIVTPAAEGRLLPDAGAGYAGAGCAERVREAGTMEYLHTLDALIGGLCDAGFVIAAFREPPRGDALAPPGSYEHRATFLPPYLKLKAVRQEG